MANKQVIKKAKKGAKKSFYDVEVPMTSVPVQLYAIDKESLDGKTIGIDLTRSLRGKSLLLTMKLVLEGDKLKGVPFKIVMAGSNAARIVRKGSDYSEDSFGFNCKDKNVRMKFLLVTKKRVSRTVRNILRQNAKKYLEDYMKSRTAEEIFTDITTNKVQKGLGLKLKKIYPLSASEVRWFEVLGDKAEEVMDKEEVSEKVEDSSE
jgi:ribosomal protein S3AE